MKKIRIATILLFTALSLPAFAGQREYRITRTDIQKLAKPLQESFAGIQYLLNPFQIRHFFSLANDDARIEWLDQFWQLRDPTPTTSKNEMRIEHNIRAKLARQFYRSKKWPGWDKRGEVFIRYGPPDYRGKVWGEVTLNRGLTPPGELWYYRNHNMLVSFQNFGLRGEYIYSIDALGAANSLSPEFAEFLAYDTGSSLSKKIPANLLEYYVAEDYIDITDRRASFGVERDQQFKLSQQRELPDNIDAIMDPDRIEMLPRDVSAVFQKDQIEKVANNFEIVLNDVPSSYPFNFNRKELPFFFGVDQFQGGASSNRVDVQIEVPVSVELENNADFEETYHAEVVIWNSQFEEVARADEDVTFRVGRQIEKWQSLIPTQMALSLPAGHYRMAITVTGLRSLHSSSFRTAFDCATFGPGLAASDILFARRIDEATTPSIFTRGALEVVPHPMRAYSRTFPMPIYFEVYNLAPDARGVATYTVEYKIIPHSGEKKRFWDIFDKAVPIVSSKFQSSAFGENDVRHLVINMEKLRGGSYDLLVTITDDNTQATTFTRGTFSLVK